MIVGVSVQQTQRSVPKLWVTPAQQRWASSLPMNTVVLFVPQQEAWVVERMGRFHRILEPVSPCFFTSSRFQISVVSAKYETSLCSLAGFELSHTYPGPNSLRAESQRDCDRCARAVCSVFGYVKVMTSQICVTSIGRSLEWVCFAFTDNVTLQIDGVLYLRILDPFKVSCSQSWSVFCVLLSSDQSDENGASPSCSQASYGVEDPEYAVTQLAQTTMRSELGKLTLDKVFRVTAGSMSSRTFCWCVKKSTCDV